MTPILIITFGLPSLTIQLTFIEVFHSNYGGWNFAIFLLSAQFGPSWLWFSIFLCKSFTNFKWSFLIFFQVVIFDFQVVIFDFQVVIIQFLINFDFWTFGQKFVHDLTSSRWKQILTCIYDITSFHHFKWSNKWQFSSASVSPCLQHYIDKHLYDS